jgi:hypothetical protein
VARDDQNLRDAAELMVPAVEKALTAYDAPDEDAAFVQVARLTARDIDRMPRQVREVMLPQHTGMLLRAFDGLDKRRRDRQKGQQGGNARVSAVDDLRTAQATRRKPRMAG